MLESESGLPRPDEPPAIAIGTSSGWGGDEGSVDVWTDGTVIFSGPACNVPMNGRRARLPPARVEALIDALDRGGWFEYDPICTDWVLDGGTASVTARRGRKANTVARHSCGSSRRDVYDVWPRFTEAFLLIAGVVGPNPCAPGARLNEELPAYSHDEAVKQIALLDRCVSAECPASRTLRAFGGQAANELIEALADPKRDHFHLEMLGNVIADAKIAAAWPALAQAGLLEQAAAAGGEETVPMLMRTYEKYYRPTDDVAGVVRVLKSLPRRTVALALPKLTSTQSDPEMWARLISGVASVAERDAIVAAAKAMPDSPPLPKILLSSAALRLGATDDWLWDVTTAAVRDRSPSGAPEALWAMRVARSAIPAERRAVLVKILTDWILEEDDSSTRSNLKLTRDQLRDVPATVSTPR